ncbi:hypothetical protein BOX15_Mlig009607g2 [Macrostomum lignano]|uniref:Calpain catalytic domain-containing protein n=2 Tax=Macrostomum lignano TaxID=282301 RepID=A0A1I8GMB2_9PLAT|nr:hypothetical protein BOX15_Mlig009607g2 [Macrostomum lignano]
MEVSTTETRDSVSSADEGKQQSLPGNSGRCGHRVQFNQHQQELADVAAYCRAKCKEWLSVGAYPMDKKLAEFFTDSAMQRTAATGWCSFRFTPGDLESVWCRQFARTLEQLGWTATDAAQERPAPPPECQLQPPSLPPPLLLGPEAALSLRRQPSFVQHAARVVCWDCRQSDEDGNVGGVSSYWKLCETLESFERSLHQLAGMRLLMTDGDADQQAAGNKMRRGDRICRGLESADFLLPTLHLGEVWGRRLALFLKAQGDCCFHLRPERAADASPAKSVVYYRPEPDQNSGRKRLEALESIRIKKFGGSVGRDAAWGGHQLLLLQAWPTSGQRMRLTGRDFTLDTFLLLAPRRNWIEFGCAGFFHRGLVRISQQQLPQPSKSSGSSGTSTTSSSTAAATAKASSTPGCCWLPEQLLDYLCTAEPATASWFNSVVYPQLDAVASYLAMALSQQVLDSSHAQFRLTRLSFLVLQAPSTTAGVANSNSPEGCGRAAGSSSNPTNAPPAAADCQLQVRLVDVGQCAGGSCEGAQDWSRAETLTTSRIAQEAAMIVAELMVRSGGRTGATQANWGAFAENYPARRLVAPHSMRPVFDSVDPAVQRAVLAAARRHR